MTMHQYPPNQADAIILVTIPTAYAPVTISNDAIRVLHLVHPSRPRAWFRELAVLRTSMKA